MLLMIAIPHHRRTLIQINDAWCGACGTKTAASSVNQNIKRSEAVNLAVRVREERLQEGKRPEQRRHDTVAIRPNE